MQKLNYKDFTVKAKISSLSEIEEKLKYLKAEYKGEDFQKDQYFQGDSGKLKLRLGNIENVIAHYQRIKEQDSEKTIVYRYDKNPSKEQIKELFEKHKKLAIIEKRRKIYILKNIKIHLDLLPNEEKYLEIEAMDFQNKFTNEELKRQCHQLLEELEIPKTNLIETGYSK
ncbi:hypothetical protein [Aureivirga sp. CE67]|uniref:hypothetical protein n=1 Tax=Aureivirga sp. CE67 TaxID=1788983 RepID=UPI0018C9A3E8|nr:hypothetical protein [Aureivirga sp. CE67]